MGKVASDTRREVHRGKREEKRLREAGAADPGEVEPSAAQDGSPPRPRARLKAWAEKQDDGVDPEFYAVAVFGSRAEQSRFLDLLGLDPEARYIDGRMLAERCGIDPDDLTAAQDGQAQDEQEEPAEE